MATLKAQLATLNEHKVTVEKSVSLQLKQNKAELQEAFSKQRAELKDAFDALRAEQETALADWQRRLLALQHGQQQYTTSSFSTRLDNLEKQLQSTTTKASESAREAVKADDAASQRSSAGDLEREEQRFSKIEKCVGSLRDHYNLSREDCAQDSAERPGEDLLNAGQVAEQPGRDAQDEGSKILDEGFWTRDYFREARSLSNLREKLSAELNEIRASSPLVTRGRVTTASAEPLPRQESAPSLSGSRVTVRQGSSEAPPPQSGRSCSSSNVADALARQGSMPRFQAAQHTVSRGPASPVIVRRSLPPQRPAVSLFTPPPSPRVTVRSGTPTIVRLR